MIKPKEVVFTYHDYSSRGEVSVDAEVHVKETGYLPPDYDATHLTRVQIQMINRLSERIFGDARRRLQQDIVSILNRTNDSQVRENLQNLADTMFDELRIKLS